MISYVIEQQDKNGTWHTIWARDLVECAWYERYKTGTSKNRKMRQRLTSLDPERDYLLADVCKYIKEMKETKPQGGFADTCSSGHGSPKNPSACLQFIQKNWDPLYYPAPHTLYYTDILALKEWASKDITSFNTARLTRKEALNWMSAVIKLVEFVKTNFLNQIIGRTPQGAEKDDPDFPLHANDSAHQSIAIANGGKWDTLRMDQDATRIVFYRDFS